MKRKKLSGVLRYKNESLPVGERVRDLVSRMSLDEKISQLITVRSPEIKRLGIPPGRWLGECLHGLVNTGRCTNFPIPMAMAATFDLGLIHQVADAISSEMRGKFHDPAWKHSPYVGLQCWTPVINIFRDPRWGRGQETYGEDPCLTREMGVSFLKGLHGNHPRYLKISGCAKHLGVHSGPERIRSSFNAVVSQKDLFETYLPAFKALIEAGVNTIMSTYNAVNGEPCCVSQTLMNEVIRKRFGFEGVIASDGGALSSPHKTHHYTKDSVETAAQALLAGLDLEIGEEAFPELKKALDQGLIAESDIDRAVGRVLTLRFKLGEFDSPSRNPYSKLRANVVQCPRHLALARKVAADSVVLLKNNGILPLTPEKKTILVTGPNAADIQVLLGNFYRGISANLKTILEGVVEAAPEGTTVTHMQGCFLNHSNDFPSTWTFGLSEWADAVVAVVGNSPLMEGEDGECIGSREGGDRSEIGLPENQLEFLRTMKGKGKPLIVVVTGGSPIAMREVHEMADAVLFAWYPGEQGGPAVGDLLFGHLSPSGRLPVTFPESIDQVPPYDRYETAGRSYRYMTAKPLYPFGFGLSYTRFRYSHLKLSRKKIRSGESVEAEVRVTNVGRRKGMEAVQVYLTDEKASVPAPRHALKAFAKVSLLPGAVRTLRFKITPEMMRLINLKGEEILEPGRFVVTIGGSSPGERSVELGAPAPVTGSFEVRE